MKTENDRLRALVEGVYHNGEDIFHRYVPTAEKMPPNNYGYDFLTGSGQKVEVKFSRLSAVNNSGARFFQWKLQWGRRKVKRHLVADRYILIGVNDADLYIYDIPRVELLINVNPIFDSLKN